MTCYLLRLARRPRGFPLLALAVLLAVAGCEPEPGRTSTGDAQTSKAPPEAAAYLVRAQQALRRADFARALALADSAAKGATSAPAAFQADVHFFRGRVLSDAKRYDEAEGAYREALRLNPDVRGAWFNLGNNAFRQQRYREAAGHYRQEQAAHPDPAVLLHLGRAYAELGVADSARWAYGEAIAADPSRPDVYARLGQLYEDEGRFEEALVQAREALRRDTANAGYRYLVGSLLLQTGDPEAALEPLQAVAEAQPQHAAAQYALGQALSRLGRTSEAERHLTLADSARALEADVERWTALVAAGPDEPARWATLAHALRRAGRPGEAARAYTSALSLDPEHLAIRNQLADLLLEMGDAASAEGHYRALLQRQSASPEAWLGLGVALAQQGRLEEARQAWQTVLRHAPDHAEARAYLDRLAQ